MSREARGKPRHAAGGQPRHAAREPGPPARWTDRVIEAGTLFLLVFTPVAFGTVQPWSEAIAELTVLAMALAWVIGMLRDWELRIELPPGLLPALLFLALIFLQVVPLPVGLVGLVAPILSALPQMASDYSGAAPAYTTLSLSPHDTLRQGLKLFSVALLFLVLYNTYRTRAQVNRAVWTMVVTSSIVALFGIMQRMTWTGHLYWVGPESPGASPFGPFVNRTHFAGLIVVAVPIALALLLADANGSRPGRRPERMSLADRLHRWSSTEAGPVRVVPLLVLLMGGAALVSGSRGGVVSLLAALLSMAGLGARGRSGARRGAQLAIATALVVLAGVWISGDVLYGTLERLAEEVGRPDESPRLHIWTDAIELWRASPIVGTGLGTFGVAFPLFRTLQAPVAFTHGESDWVQLLTDTGLLGLGLALLAAGGLGAALLDGLRRARSPRARVFALAGFVALLGAAVQGVGNYNLPLMSTLVYLAVALVVTLKTGLPAEQAVVSGRPEAALRRHPGPEERSRSQDDPPLHADAGSPDIREAAAGLLSAAATRAYRVLQRHRALVSMLVYATATAAAYAAAYLLRFELSWPAAYTGTFALSLALLVAIRLTCARVFKLAKGRWRFVGTRDVLHLASGTSAGTLVFYVATRVLPFTPAVPRSVILMECVLTVLLTAGIWLGYRVAFEQLRYRRSAGQGRATRVLIVGAGEAGNLLAREMHRLPTGYQPVGFVDDDPAKRGASLQGLPVLGTTQKLRSIARARRVEEIIIAVPSASPETLRRILDRCEATDLRVKVLPGIAEVLAGDVRLNHLRDVRIEDLLGREPIQLELPQLAEDLRGRTALITGAAGSIGSELARQVALHQPGRLVLLDQAETDLFYLELELREKHPDLQLVPIVGDVVDAGTVERVFRDYTPARVYHAAAYKHVPMMEVNAREAVRNNVIGTWRVAETAGRYGTEKLVLVSTDKAVRPVNVMGATKRLAELAVLELQERYPETAYAAVRFGNVLGSQGSVIPIFKQQIEAGKPLTVTHPEATRYFMTIPEAVQLILQASLLPEMRGRIAMLEMGEPVRIVDLARKLQRLMGRPSGNGQGLTFTGLRPGERLHEELVAPDEEAVPTAIVKVKLIASRNGTAAGLGPRIAEWERRLAAGEDFPVADALAEFCPGLRGGAEVRAPLGRPAVAAPGRPVHPASRAAGTAAQLRQPVEPWAPH